jgi:hypothetical protein
MAVRWKTTNVRLPHEDWRALKIRAAREEKSVGQLVREAIEMLLGRRPAPGDADRVGEADPVYGLVGLVESGVRDGSERHDDVLYPARRKTRKRTPSKGRKKR